MRKILSSMTLGLAACAACAATPINTDAASAAAPRFVFSPYKHLAMWSDPATHVIRVAPDGKARPYLGGADAGGAPALTWAFATGECGAEVWGAERAQDVAAANVAAFVAAHRDYLISTGGERGIFSCASDAGMESFIARYASPQLIGFDFDIEAGQTDAAIDTLIARIANAQKAHPQLRMSFTVATHAATDGSLFSLNRTGEAVLAALRKHGVQGFVLNLMVMDYGPATADSCVVVKGRCDMAASALQAARNVGAKYALPMSQIELTAMIGVNDVVDNIFTPADARAVAQATRANGLAGLHYWSLDRDTPCPAPAAGAVSTCSSMTGVPAGAFLRAFADGLR